MANLERLNAYRVAQGLRPVKVWRPDQHQYFLDMIVEPWERLMQWPSTDLSEEYERIRTKPEFEASLEEQRRFDTIAMILRG